MNLTKVSTAALVGAATGGRTFTGLAALALTAPQDARSNPDRVLARPAVRVAICLAALGELVADKLPNTPSRLAPPGLIGRIAVGATCGAIVARRALRPAVDVPTADADQPAEQAPADLVACVGAATVGALGGTALGSWCRGAAGSDGLPAVGAALAEDAAVIGLAAAACY